MIKIKEEKRGDVLVFLLSGELMGGEETRAFQDRLYKAIEEGSVFVVIDMSNVGWMNSSGLGMLMAGLTTLRGSGGELKLAGTPDRIRRTIEITKLDNVIPIYDSLDEAVDSFAQGG